MTERESELFNCRVVGGGLTIQARREVEISSRIWMDIRTESNKLGTVQLGARTKRLATPATFPERRLTSVLGPAGGRSCSRPPES